MFLQEEDTDLIERKIKDALKSLQMGFRENGGELNFVNYSRGILTVQFVGHHVGCPSNRECLLSLIEKEVKQLVLEVDRVEAL